MDPQNTSVVAESLPSHAPLVILRRVGQGRVYTCAVPYFEGSSRGLSQLALKLFDSIIVPLQPVRITGLPLEWGSSSLPDGGKIVTLSNHAEKSWTGAIDVKLSSNAAITCQELRRNQSCLSRAQRDGSVRTMQDIAAFDTIVIRLRCQLPLKTDDRDDAYDRNMTIVKMEFRNGELVVDTSTGAYTIRTDIDGLKEVRSADYRLWWEGI